MAKIHLTLAKIHLTLDKNTSKYLSVIKYIY